MSTQQTVHDNLTSVRMAHPIVADKMEMRAMQTLQFLHEKMPKDPGTVTSLGVSRWKPPEAELVKFANYVRAVEDPISVLEDAADGTITPQGAEVLRTLYPAMFAEAQKQLVMNADKLRENSTLDHRVRLSVLFGVTVDSSMSPSFTKFSQNHWSQRATEAKTVDGAQLESDEPTEAQSLLGT